MRGLVYYKILCMKNLTACFNHQIKATLFLTKAITIEATRLDTRNVIRDVI